MVILFLVAATVLYIVCYRLVAYAIVVTRPKARRDSVSIDLGCWYWLVPIWMAWIVGGLYVLRWIQTGVFAGCELESVIRFLGLSDPFLKETSLLGIQKIHERLLRVDIVWYLLILACFVGLAEEFSESLQTSIAALIKKLDPESGAD